MRLICFEAQYHHMLYQKHKSLFSWPTMQLTAFLAHFWSILMASIVDWLSYISFFLALSLFWEIGFWFSVSSGSWVAWSKIMNLGMLYLSIVSLSDWILITQNGFKLFAISVMLYVGGRQCVRTIKTRFFHWWIIENDMQDCGKLWNLLDVSIVTMFVTLLSCIQCNSVSVRMALKRVQKSNFKLERCYICEHVLKYSRCGVDCCRAWWLKNGEKEEKWNERRVCKLVFVTISETLYIRIPVSL